MSIETGLRSIEWAATNDSRFWNVPPRVFRSPRSVSPSHRTPPSAAKRFARLNLMAALGTTPALRFDRGQRRQAIVESIIAEVLQGRLRAGQHLGTQELAERHGVSHTPIREALVALA